MDDCLTLWVSDAEEAGIDLGSLGRRMGQSPSRLEPSLSRLERDQRVLRVPDSAGKEPRWLAPRTVRKVAARADRLLKSYFKRNRLATGIPKAEFIERILPRRAIHLAPVFLDWLQAEKVLVVEGDQVRRPGRSAELTHEESQLAKDIVSSFSTAALQPPAPAEIRDNLAAKPQIFDGVIGYLLERGDLLRLPGGLLISAAAIDRVIRELGSLDRDEISVSEFKERFELTRKWAIPILEYLDSAGVTRRIGDQRQIVRRTA